MEAVIHHDSLGNFIIQIKGEINHQVIKQFQEQANILIKKYPTSTISIDMSNIDFVGSSSIKTFARILDKISKVHNKIKLINVRTEFTKIFKFYSPDLVDLVETEELPPIYRRFQLYK